MRGVDLFVSYSNGERCNLLRESLMQIRLIRNKSLFQELLQLIRRTSLQKTGSTFVIRLAFRALPHLMFDLALTGWWMDFHFQIAYNMQLSWIPCFFAQASTRPPAIFAYKPKLRTRASIVPT